MTPTADIRIIINPASASGRTGHNIPALTRALLGAFPRNAAIALTRRRGHAEELAADAVHSRRAMIVAVGGDGTIHEVVNGMLAASEGATPDTLLGVLRCGSGSGFALSLGLPPGLDAQAGILRAGTVRTIDAGVLRMDGERPARRYFINECQIGIGADVVRRNTGLCKSAGGFIGYGAATIASILCTRNSRLRISVDGAPLCESSCLGLSIGNGALTGGGMALTPGADLADGYLDLLVIRGQSLLSRLRSFPRIYRGTHIDSPHFDYRKASAIAVEGERGVAVAADGEPMGEIPCTVGILPGALHVIVPTTKEYAHATDR